MGLRKGPKGRTDEFYSCIKSGKRSIFVIDFIFVAPSYVWLSIELSVLQSNDLLSEGEEVYDTCGALNSLKIVLFASFVPRYDTNLFISFFCVKGQNN